MRLFLSAILALAVAFPALAETRKERAARCAAQADIVAQAVEMRRKMKSEKKVRAALGQTIDAKYAPSITPLVGFVFTLPRKDLKSDVAGAFTKQCEAYKP